MLFSNEKVLTLTLNLNTSVDEISFESANKIV